MTALARTIAAILVAFFLGACLGFGLTVGAWVRIGQVAP